MNSAEYLNSFWRESGFYRSQWLRVTMSEKNMQLKDVGE